MVTIETLRFWCQKVLPLVYDDSLSYYELLGKIVSKTNEVITNSNNANDAIEILNSEYSVLNEKVQGLIDNLVDVIVPWNSEVAYGVYSIVEYQGTNYIAIQDVPVGIMITNTEYWQPANTVLEQINAIGVTVSDLQTIVGDSHSVTYYGADNTGAEKSDGAISLAIEANKGSYIYFPSGTYQISSPIETYEGVADACSIIMADDARIYTNDSLDCIFYIGSKESDTPLVYPYPTYRREISGGVIDGRNCDYAIKFANTTIQYTLENSTIIADNNGIEIGASGSTVSQDTRITDCYIQSQGSQVAGDGIVINGKDNIVSNCKIYGFRRGVIVNGGLTYINDVHVLGQYRGGITVTDDIFTPTRGFYINSETFIIDCYVDGLATYAETNNVCHIIRPVFHLYTSLYGLSCKIFILNSIYLTEIKGGKFDIPPSNCKGIVFSDAFITTKDRITNLIKNGFKLDNTPNSSAYNLSGGDLLNHQDDITVVKDVFMSNTRNFETNTWYRLGYVVMLPTQVCKMEITIGNGEYVYLFRTNGATPPVPSSMKLYSPTSDTGISFGVRYLNSDNNCDLFELCVMATTNKLVNYTIPKLTGCLFIPEIRSAGSNYPEVTTTPSTSLAI